MRKVFEAMDMLEAHVVKGLLQQEGITGFIQGEYLQGGMGDLPAAGFVSIEVNDPDYDMARSVISEWEQEQKQQVNAVNPRSAWAPAWAGPFLMGLMVGVLLTLWLT